MAIFTVHLPQDGDPARAFDRLVLVREGFSLTALILPPLWLLWHRLWFGIALYLAALFCIAAVAQALDLSETIVFLLVLLAGAAVALEGGALRRLALTRRGFRFLGVVGGRDYEEAERAAMAQCAGKSALPTPPARPASSGGGFGAQPEVIGLFPHSGGNR